MIKKTLLIGCIRPSKCPHLHIGHDWQSNKAIGSSSPKVVNEIVSDKHRQNLCFLSDCKENLFPINWSQHHIRPIPFGSPFPYCMKIAPALCFPGVIAELSDRQMFFHVPMKCLTSHDGERPNKPPSCWKSCGAASAEQLDHHRRPFWHTSCVCDACVIFQYLSRKDGPAESGEKCRRKKIGREHFLFFLILRVQRAQLQSATLGIDRSKSPLGRVIPPSPRDEGARAAGIMYDCEPRRPSPLRYIGRNLKCVYSAHTALICIPCHLFAVINGLAATAAKLVACTLDEWFFCHEVHPANIMQTPLEFRKVVLIL